MRFTLADLAKQFAVPGNSLAVIRNTEGGIFISCEAKRPKIVARVLRYFFAGFPQPAKRENRWTKK